MTHVIILRGLPGCGKSTMVEKYPKIGNTRMFLFVHQIIIL